MCLATMGSTAPNSQNHLPQYHHLRGNYHSATSLPATMSSHETKSKDFAPSVYPSPADEVHNNFSAPPSPVFQEQATRRESYGKVTLPSIRDVVQMPSPSTSPRLPVASFQTSTNEFANPHAAEFTDYSQNPGKPLATFNQDRDPLLFFGLPNVRDELVDPQPFFAAMPRSSQGQTLMSPTNTNALPSLPQRMNSRTGGASFGSIPQRQRKRPVEDSSLRNPPTAGDPSLRSPSLWQKQKYAIGNGLAQEYPDLFPSPCFPPPPTANSTPAGAFQNDHHTANRTSHKRKVDDAIVTAPPKTNRVNARRDSGKGTKSPYEAPLGAPEPKRVRRTQDANKPKAPRVLPEKTVRDYSVYPDYCPPLSTLDDDQVAFPSVDWKAAPCDMSKHPDSDLLHPKEIAIASKLVLTPSVYIYIKRRFFAYRLKYARTHATFNINAAQLACKGVDEFNITGIDVNKTSRLHKAFEKVGWLDEKHMERFL